MRVYCTLLQCLTSVTKSPRYPVRYCRIARPNHLTTCSLGNCIEDNFDETKSKNQKLSVNIITCNQIGLNDRSDIYTP